MAQTSERFAGQTVIVTGAGAGIGRATALAFVTEGARVVASDISADRLAALAQEGGLSIVTVPGDVSQQSVVDQIAAAAAGRVDVLVNNAGIMDGFLPLGEVDDATWTRVMAVNLEGPMRLSRAVLPGMVAAGHGAIVNISSEAGLRGASAGVAYTTSKHALIGMTLNTAFMYGALGIRVNAVAPGAVETSIEAPFKSALAGERLGKVFPAVVPGTAQPEQLAATILFLASDAASNVNGVVLPCDGGWSAI